MKSNELYAMAIMCYANAISEHFGGKTSVSQQTICGTLMAVVGLFLFLKEEIQKNENRNI
jgi:hypothetical protein